MTIRGRWWDSVRDDVDGLFSLRGWKLVGYHCYQWEMMWIVSGR
jgi:hypothetical protein